MAKVILRPLEAEAWSGVIKYKNCYEDLAPYFTRSGSIYTGLTDEDSKRLGEKLGKDLNRGSDFWKTFFIRTMGKDLILNTDDPTDELKYLFLKNHKRVKNSIFEHKATANFVLIDQETESKKTNLFNRVKRDAITELGKMTTDEMKKALRLFGKASENLSPDVVENRLFEIVEANPDGFLNLWVNNKSRETQYIVERAVSLNIIRRNKTIYSYGSDIIGNSLEDTVLFLDNPANQEIRVAIMKQVDGKAIVDNAYKQELVSDVNKIVAKKAKKLEDKNQAVIDNLELMK